MACSTFVFDYLGKSSYYFTLIGLAFALTISYRFIRQILHSLFIYFIAPLLGFTNDLKHFGEWAVVTGATDGIGKAYAEQLAKRGIKVILISRSSVKLANVAKEIENKYNVKTWCITADFTEGLDLYRRLKSELQDFEIGILVNNVGMSNKNPPDYFLVEENRDQTLPALINVNCLTVSEMTSICMPAMVERRKGVIINISSVAGMFPTPMLTLYSASKAFMDYLSRALHYEYSRKGIIIQNILPGYVATNMTELNPFSFIVPSAEMYARSSLNTVGLATRCCGYWIHGIMAWITAVVPEWFRDVCVFNMYIRVTKGRKAAAAAAAAAAAKKQ